MLGHGQNVCRKKPQNKTSWFLKTIHLNRKQLKISLHRNQRRTGFQVVNNGSRPRHLSDNAEFEEGSGAGGCPTGGAIEGWQGQTCSHIESAWCVLGDFNSVLDVEDRIGGNILTPHKKGLSVETLLDNCGLFNIYPSGCTCTWSNRREGVGGGFTLKLIEFSSIKNGCCYGMMQELCYCHRESLITPLQRLAL
ncbi:hypothetical protein Cgig2_001098 [Carnegiea gigantea]|uniref:Endonuclease/exonuclease/phosphatase n=1 Tax=Carnegiea gigantea TaxID=171969 RepID=A0A9Q1JX61_9CARY|nr:hypothetical protein Cgig2_001098 [Carnegiea gigantea]